MTDASISSFSLSSTAGSKKRKTSRRSTSIRRTSVARRGAHPLKFPRWYADQAPKKLVKLKYVAQKYFSNDSGTLGVLQFHANGMFDPDNAVGGHQPYGFDQMMAMYKYYTVVSSTCHVQLLVGSEVADYEPNVIGVSLVDQAGRVASAFGAGAFPVEGVMEMPFISKTLTDNPSATEKSRSIYLKFNATNFFGKKLDSMIGDDDYRGDGSGNPASTALFEIWRCPLQGDANPRQDIIVTITYLAIFTAPKWFTIS